MNVDATLIISRYVWGPEALVLLVRAILLV